MISGSELRKGITIELEGKLYQVIDYQHIKMKRTALARVKLRDIRAGHTIERTFSSAEKLTLQLYPVNYSFPSMSLRSRSRNYEVHKRASVILLGW